MIYKSDIIDIYDELEEYFPEIAIGNKSKMRDKCFRKVKQVHLFTWRSSDSYGGAMIMPFHSMYALIEWDINYGFMYRFCFEEKEDFIEQVLKTIDKE
jgi:hypothetical protein